MLVEVKMIVELSLCYIKRFFYIDKFVAKMAKCHLYKYTVMFELKLDHELIQYAISHLSGFLLIQ